MVSLADSLVSSSARKLSMRIRPDLTSRRQRYLGQSYWVVKEPVGLNYFRFQEEEYAILQMLNGDISLDEIKEQFESEFPPQKITVEELQQFIGTLHRSGLILANVPGQGIQLKKRRDERKRKERLAALTNILCIRFKGIDPDRILNTIYPWFRWIYSLPGVIGAVTLAVSALLLVTVQFDVFQSKLPAFNQFFTVQNAVWMAVALGVTKVIHEFGHGLTCKHFGGECHEMGVMILVLTPCLYCNVSDSWMLPSKWRRAAIGAAGMYIEVVIASICTFIWWFSEPGMLNQLSLSTMFVCSVSTVIFNANPLLRYDGYYILSDLTEIPNLRQKSSDILARKLGWWCLGIERPDDPFLPQRKQMFFALYTVAAAVYRWFVVLSILWFLYKIWEPYRLEIIGQAIGSMAIYGLLVQPLVKVGKFFWVPGRVEKVKKARMFATIGLLAAAVTAIVMIPLPYRVLSTLEIKPRDAEVIYVDPAGILEQISVKPGDQVTSSDELARLTNLDVDLQIASLEAQRDRQRTMLNNLEQQQHDDPVAAMEIAPARKVLEAIEDQLLKRQEDRENLTLRVPEGVSGTIFPPASVASRPSHEGQLPSRSGTPLQARNLGAWLDEGEEFCQIGDPTRWEAILVVDQEDVEFVHEGQTVEINLDELPEDVLSTKVEFVSPINLKVSPKQLSNKAGGGLATETDESGVERPLSVSYQVVTYLPDPEGILRVGLRGQAKIHAGTQTLGARFWRYLKQTFHFDFNL